MGKYFKLNSLVILVILLFTLLFFSPNLGLVPTVLAAGAIFSLDFDEQYLYAATKEGNRSGIVKTFVIARLRSGSGDLYRLLRFARNDNLINNYNPVTVKCYIGGCET